MLLSEPLHQYHIPEYLSEYRKVTLQNHAAFLNAADYALPSVTDREHLDENGHAALADAIYDKIIALQKGLSNVI